MPRRLHSLLPLLARSWKSIPLAARRRIMWLVQPKYTVGVSAVVLNDRDEILLLRHRFRERDGWQFPGGYVMRGEDLNEAIRRELREETGLDVVIADHVSADLGHELHVDLYRLARVVGGSLRPDARELLDARFFTRSDLPHVLDEGGMRTIELALGPGPK